MSLSSKWQNLKVMLFHNASLRQTVFKNTFWLTVSNIGGRLIRAILLIYVARVLGAEGYGVFSYAVGIAAFFSIFADFGVTGILTREGARKPETFPEYLGTAILLKFSLLAITNVIIFAAVPFASNIPEILPLLPLVILLITSDGFRDIAFAVTRAKEKMEKEALMNIFTNVAITILGLGLLLYRLSPGVLLAGYASGSLLGTLLSVWLIRKELKVGIPKAKKALMIPMLREGFPFALSGILGTLMLNMDMIMLGWLTNKESLGLYSAAQRPIQILYMIPGIMAIALFPSFSRMALREKERFKSIFERSLSISILAALPIAVGGFIVAEQLIVLLFGAEFRSSVPAFQALLITLVMNFPGIFLGNAIFAHNEQKSLAWFLSLGALSNFFFNYLFIPIWGILGCAFATIGAQLISQIFVWMKVKKLTGMVILPYLKKMVFATILMGILTWSLQELGLHILLNVAISGAVFFGMLLLLEEKLLNEATAPFYRASKRL